MQDNASVKAKMINLINSVRTLMRGESFDGTSLLNRREQADIGSSAVDLRQPPDHRMGYNVRMRARNTYNELVS